MNLFRRLGEEREKKERRRGAFRVVAELFVFSGPVSLLPRNYFYWAPVHIVSL